MIFLILNKSDKYPHAIIKELRIGEWSELLSLKTIEQSNNENIIEGVLGQ